MYTVTQSEPIAVYGGGILGCSVTKYLIEDGFNVVAIIDKYPSGVNPWKGGVNAITATDAMGKYGNIFIYIALVDASKHFEVAFDLHKIGFDRILFVPLLLRSKTALNMMQCWNAWLDRKYIEVPLYDELFGVFSDDFILDEISDYVTVIIHKKHVYTRDYKYTWQSNILMRNHSYLQQYINYLRHYPLNIEKRIHNRPISDEHIKKYVQENSPTSAELSLYYGKMMFSPYDFYMTSASPAILNFNGKFTLLDGAHRNLMLIDKGFSGLPLRVARDDWVKYFHESEAQMLMNVVKIYGCLPKEVYHPAFVLLPVKERDPTPFINIELFIDV